MTFCAFEIQGCTKAGNCVKIQNMVLFALCGKIKRKGPNNRERAKGRGGAMDQRMAGCGAPRLIERADQTAAMYKNESRPERHGLC